MSPVDFITYFGKNMYTKLPNDAVRVILSFLCPPKILEIIDKINALLKILSNYDKYYLIYGDCLCRIPYDKNKNYSQYQIDHQRFREIIWILENMPLLYEADNRKNYKIGLGSGEKHSIENMYQGNMHLNSRMSTRKEIFKKKLPNNEVLLFSNKLKQDKAVKNYISRSAVALAFMIAGFERDKVGPDGVVKFTFRCKQVKLTEKIILEYADLFRKYHETGRLLHIFTPDLILED